MQSEQNARKAIEHKRAQAKEQATSIRQYSLNRGGHAPPIGKQNLAANPLFVETDSREPEDSSSKNANEVFAEAGKVWRGRSKLQQEREAFEREAIERRVQSSKNRMAVLYPNKSEAEQKSKKRVAAKITSAPRKKPRTGSEAPTYNVGDDGNEGRPASVHLQSSPYSGRIPKPKSKPKSQTRKRKSSEVVAEKAPVAPKLDDEAIKAKFISRKVTEVIASGQGLTTELYQQFQREASAELARNTSAVEVPADPIKVCIALPILLNILR